MSTENRRTVESYIAGFNASDHEKILSCLTDDVEWVIPGAFHGVGKAAFDAEIENPGFEGRPVVTVVRYIEMNGVVVAEGNVRGHHAGGAEFRAAFCDLFDMRDGKIRKVTSYLAMLGGDDPGEE